MTKQEEIEVLKNLLEILRGSNPADPDKYKQEIEKLQEIIDQEEKEEALPF